ncbi:hypothetical protein BDV39DRAFT_179362 [Aspergillus sergii]|uniref:Uncharacterized protein n=1 Tax=Aspergillus sergii TaxID=1034303 RepID=A0A5N6WYJ9_9EURO|nr:hypothetical protein BDV39DRAFT_179362 [Aspergillus sergii]
MYRLDSHKVVLRTCSSFYLLPRLQGGYLHPALNCAQINISDKRDRGCSISIISILCLLSLFDQQQTIFCAARLNPVLLLERA